MIRHSQTVDKQPIVWHPTSDAMHDANHDTLKCQSHRMANFYVTNDTSSTGWNGNCGQVLKNQLRGYELFMFRPIFPEHRQREDLFVIPQRLYLCGLKKKKKK